MIHSRSFSAEKTVTSIVVAHLHGDTAKKEEKERATDRETFRRSPDSEPSERANWSHAAELRAGLRHRESADGSHTRFTKDSCAFGKLRLMHCG